MTFIPEDMSMIWGGSSNDDDDSTSKNYTGCLLVVVGVVTALVVSVVVLFIVWLTKGTPAVPADLLARIDTLEQTTTTLSDGASQAAKELAGIKSTLSNLASVPPEAQLKASLDAMTARVESVDGRVKVVEAGLQNNPEKLLVVPLLRKDVETLTTQVTDLKATMQAFQTAAIAVVTSLGGLLLGGVAVIVRDYFKAKGRAPKRRAGPPTPRPDKASEAPAG
jgi:hypothetical protein